MTRTAILTLVFAFAISGFTATLASAGEVGASQVRQRARIHHGVENGTLLPREARRLAIEQNRIKRTKQKLVENDGKLGPAERAHLARKQNRASRHIFRAKHNARAR